jgi:hypothetical protein
MGLAPYGIINSKQTIEFIETIKINHITVMNLSK